MVKNTFLFAQPHHMLMCVYRNIPTHPHPPTHPPTHPTLQVDLLEFIIKFLKPSDSVSIKVCAQDLPFLPISHVLCFPSGASLFQSPVKSVLRDLQNLIKIWAGAQTWDPCYQHDMAANELYANKLHHNSFLSTSNSNLSSTLSAITFQHPYHKKPAPYRNCCPDKSGTCHLLILSSWGHNKCLQAYREWEGINKRWVVPVADKAVHLSGLCQQMDYSLLPGETSTKLCGAKCITVWMRASVPGGQMYDQIFFFL